MFHPGLDVVRVGIIGIGNRGTGTVRRLASIEGVKLRLSVILNLKRSAMQSNLSDLWVRVLTHIQVGRMNGRRYVSVRILI
jgi:predicted homoserine dehydrogenase-like protein